MACLQKQSPGVLAIIADFLDFEDLGHLVHTRKTNPPVLRADCVQDTVGSVHIAAEVERLHAKSIVAHADEGDSVLSIPHHKRRA